MDPMSGGAKLAGGHMLAADMRIDGAPSVFFDAVMLVVSDAGAEELVKESAAINFVSDAFNHLKIIGYVPAAEPLLRRAGVTADLGDGGVVALADARAIPKFIVAAKKLRMWEREPKVRYLP